MKYPQRVQVLFTEEQFKTLEEIAARRKKKLGTLIREVVEETYLMEEEKRKVKDAVDSLLKLAEESPAPAPASWENWEKEYSKLKSGHSK